MIQAASYLYSTFTAASESFLYFDTYTPNIGLELLENCDGSAENTRLEQRYFTLVQRNLTVRSNPGFKKTKCAFSAASSI